MACMEHVCPCGHMWFNNRGGGDCPKCGNDRNIGHFYDEADMDTEEEDDEDE